MRKSTIILAVIMTALSLAGGIEEASAGGHWTTRTVSTGGARGGGTVRYVSVYVRTPSSYIPVTLTHHIAPPGFPYEWFAKDAAESFIKNNLEIDIASTSKDENMPDAANIKECMKIFVASDGRKHEACILTFEKKEDLEAQQGHYLALNEKGELYNWSFVKDNMLVVLDGSVSEEDARLYEDSLCSLKEDK